MTVLSYSTRMDTKNVAPEIAPGYPYKRRVFPAWQEAWDRLAAGGAEYQDGTVLSDEIAPRYGLAPSTLRNVLRAAQHAGLLDWTERPVRMEMRRHGAVIASKRARAHYRIKKD